LRQHVFGSFPFFSGFRKIKNPIGQMQWLCTCCKIHPKTGLEIATDAVTNAANIFFLQPKILVYSRHFGDQISL